MWNGSLLSPPLGTIGVPEAGADLGGMLALPPGGKVLYVRGDGTSPTAYSDDPAGFAEKLYPSVKLALAGCVSGRGDRILVLPGHTENIATANAWAFVAGVKIIGMGSGTLRPTFTWTATASTLLLNVANVGIANCQLLMEPGTGTVSVTTPMTISAAGCSIIGCRVRMSTDASNLAPGGIVTTAAADDLTLVGNKVLGATAGAGVLLTLVGADRLYMRDNMFKGASTAVGVGVVIFATTASTDIWLEGNTYINKLAASVYAVTGLAACSGVSRNEHFSTLDNAVTNTTLLPWGTSSGLMTFHRPTVSNAVGEVGSENVGLVSA